MTHTLEDSRSSKEIDMLAVLVAAAATSHAQFVFLVAAIVAIVSIVVGAWQGTAHPWAVWALVMAVLAIISIGLFLAFGS